MALDNTNNPSELEIIDLPRLKSWFVTAAKPTQSQFHGLLNSYYHKSSQIPMSGINGLSTVLGNKADASQLQYYAKTDASNINAQAWKDALNVGNLPPNVATIDYIDENGLTQNGNAYKKVDNPDNGERGTYVLGIDGRAVAIDDFGKNVTNSNNTTDGSYVQTQSEGDTWMWNTNGEPFSISNLPNKDNDTLFDTFIGQDISGQLGRMNGYNAILKTFQNATSQQKVQIGLALNPNMTTASPYVSSASIIFLQKNQEYTISIYGSDLLLPDVGSSVVLRGVADGRILNSISWSNNTNTALTAVFKIPNEALNQNWQVIVTKGLIPSTGDLQLVSVDSLVYQPITWWSTWKRSSAIPASDIILGDNSFALRSTDAIPLALDGLLLTAKTQNILLGSKNWELTFNIDKMQSRFVQNYDFIGITNSQSNVAEGAPNLSYGFRFNGGNGFGGNVLAGYNQDAIPIGGRFGGGENYQKHAQLKITKISNFLTIYYDNGSGEDGVRNPKTFRYDIDPTIDWAITIGKENSDSVDSLTGTIQLLMN